MSSKGTMPPRDMKKFMFDVHNFDEREDEDVETIVESAPPPPPTFSQDELEAARTAAYEQGKRDGLAEALNSFEMQIADTLGIIRDHFSILFDAEDRRIRTFEKEAVQLAYTVFAKTFPALNEKHGMDEVKQAMASILETVREQPELVIDVPPAYVSAIQHHVDGLLRLQDGPRCTIRANDSLLAGQCKMAWVNGSAVRNPTALVQQIQDQIEHLLADKAKLNDNDNAASLPPSGMTKPETENGEPE